MSYAEQNRREWKEKGESIVQGYLAKFPKDEKRRQPNEVTVSQPREDLNKVAVSKPTEDPNEVSV